MIAMNELQIKNHMMNEDKPILVEYWAPWCVYCRRIAPALKRVSEQFSGELTVAQVNIDEEPRLAVQEKIEVIPTLVMYRNGIAVASIVAPESKAMIDAFIQENLGK